MGRKRSESDYFNSLRLHSDLGCTQLQVLTGGVGVLLHGSSSHQPLVTRLSPLPPHT